MNRALSQFSKLLVALLIGPTFTAVAAEPLRITQLQRCGDLLDKRHPTFCVTAAGVQHGEWQARLNGAPLTTEEGSPDDGPIKIQLDATKAKSGPLWLEQNGRFSNPVWLSLGSSHVLAASEHEVAKNADDLTTYVNLISVIIEEQHEGAKELAGWPTSTTPKWWAPFRRSTPISFAWQPAVSINATPPYCVWATK